MDADRRPDGGCVQRRQLAAGIFDFTAQCSPERIENLLLFHSDAPEATWLKTFDEWKQAGRSVRGGEAGYTALIGQDYTREDGTAASGYYVGKKFDVSQTRGRQPDRAPVYAADELVTAVFTNSPVRLAVSEAVPEDTGAVCSPKPYHLCAQQYGRADHVPCHCAGTGGGQL